MRSNCSVGSPGGKRSHRARARHGDIRVVFADLEVSSVYPLTCTRTDLSKEHACIFDLCDVGLCVNSSSLLLSPL